MNKLTATHLNILGLASDRENGLISRPAAMKAAAADKVAAKLIDLGLVREIRGKATMPIWRTDNDGKAFSLKILKAGRETLKSAEVKTESSADLAGAAKQDATTNAEVLQANALACSDHGTPRSKRTIVLSLLERQEGATIVDLMAATGWLAHTTRAALSGLRKKGCVIVRDRDPEQQASVYRLEPQSSAAAA